MPEEVEELEQQRRMEAERLAQMQQLSHQDDDLQPQLHWRRKPVSAK